MATRVEHARTPAPGPIAQPGPSGNTDVAIEDLLEGPAELTVGRTGLRGVRTFFVPDVSGAGARVYAIALLAPNVPRVDVTSWPGIEALLCSELVVRPSNGPTDFEVVASYGFPSVGGGPFDNPPDAEAVPTLEIDSAVVMKRTNIDIGGNIIQIEGYHARAYDEETGEPLEASNAKAEPIQGGMVDVPVVLTVLRYRRREPPVDDRGRGVAYKSKLFTGKTNSVDVDGSGAHTWLCSRVGVASDDRDLSFNMTYEFTFDPARWRSTLVYVDPTTGQPGDNLSVDDPITMSGNGVKTFQVVGSEDFHTLDLHL